MICHQIQSIIKKRNHTKNQLEIMDMKNIMTKKILKSLTGKLEVADKRISESEEGQL